MPSLSRRERGGRNADEFGLPMRAGLAVDPLEILTRALVGNSESGGDVLDAAP